MGMSLEKHCGNCEYVGYSTNKTPCVYCSNFSNWVPDHYMLERYPGNILRKMIHSNPKPLPVIKDVIFNPPATIVKWGDGTKTVVKCQGDDMFDPEKGVAMAIAKKAMGNTGSYFNHIKKWTDEYYKDKLESMYGRFDVQSFIKTIIEAKQNAFTFGFDKE